MQLRINIFGIWPASWPGMNCNITPLLNREPEGCNVVGKFPRSSQRCLVDCLSMASCRGYRNQPEPKKSEHPGCLLLWLPVTRRTTRVHANLYEQYLAGLFFSYEWENGVLLRVFMAFLRWVVEETEFENIKLQRHPAVTVATAVYVCV